MEGTGKLKNIKLLICYHKPDTILQDEVMTPIHVGRAIAKQKAEPNDPKLKWLLENMIGDDTGENISLRNGSYNELTSLYWAWKNYDKLGNPEYIGLMHYRRHFVLREGEVKVYNIDRMDNVDEYFKQLNYSPQKLSDMLDGYDFACHIGKVNGIYHHYLDNHRPEDIRLALSFLSSKYQKVAEEYLNQDLGNFCNMFIFSKKIFFDYCEWIFDVLQKFEDAVDTSEKRFFISERLTGIYIYNLMKEGYKYKVLPISFVSEPVNVPITMPLSEENAFAVAAVIASALKNIKNHTSYTFYMLSSTKICESLKSKFESLKRISDACTFEFIQTNVERQYFPLVLSELVPVNKCLYITEKILVMQDLSEFFRTCSVDDYYAVGLPQGMIDIYTEEKTVELEGSLMIHCGKFRKYKLYEKCKEDILQGKNGTEIFNCVCHHQLGYYPYWFTTVTTDLDNSNLFANKQKKRSEYKEEALWRPLLYFKDIKPWLDSQFVYSIFWWDSARLVPVEFEFIKIDFNELKFICAKRQNEIDHIRNILDGKVSNVKQPPSYIPQTEAVPILLPYSEKGLTQTSESFVPNCDANDNISMIKKIKRFYRQYGIKKTVKRFFQKIFIGGEYVDKK